MDIEQVDLIQRKLGNMIAYVDELSPYLAISYREYRGRASNRRIVERLAQVIVECAIDINELLLGEASQPPVQSARRLQAYGYIETGEGDGV